MPTPDETVEGLKLVKATLEDRVTQLEAMVSKLSEHQINLGNSLIRAHQKLIELEGDMAAEGIANQQDATRNSIIGIKPPRIIS